MEISIGDQLKTKYLIITLDLSDGLLEYALQMKTIVVSTRHGFFMIAVMMT